MTETEHEHIKGWLREHEISAKPDYTKIRYIESEKSNVRQGQIRKETYARFFKTGSSYSGEWSSIDMHGFGKYTFPHGVIYEGGMKNGEFHGEGKLSYPMGQSIKGIFRNGEMISWEYSFGQCPDFSLKNYCKFPDRRYMRTLKDGFLPPGRERVTERKPERPIPENHYDVEDGFYNPRTKWIYSAQSLPTKEEPTLLRMALNSVKPIETKKYLPDGSSFIKQLPFVPVYQDEKFILEHCRKAWDEPTGYRTDLYEKWMSGRAKEDERYRKKFITKSSVEESDSNCLKLLDFFSRFAKERRKEVDI